MSEHTIKRNQLPQLRRLLEDVPFQGHDHLVTKGITLAARDDLREARRGLATTP